jgi:uncharacterized protein YeaO (DUF488 family)
MIGIKRIYEHRASGDGYRMLVDRLWPRGLSKDKAHIDLWLRDIGPSNELRRWFGHDPAKWKSFKFKYEQELKDKQQQIAELKQLERKHKKITLVYSARDEQHNQAVVIASVLKNKHAAD